MDINDKINKLNQEERKVFYNDLRDVLHDREWCYCNKIKYSNPDVEKAKEKLYQEEYQQNRKK